MSITRLDFNNIINNLDEIGVVIDYIPYYVDDVVDYHLHKQIAIMGMEEIKEKCYQRAVKHATKNIKIEDFFQVTITKDPSGNPVNISKFLGDLNAFKQRISPTSWVVPNVSGYKTAFFNPPYGLRGELEKQKEIYNTVNNLLLAPIVDSNLIIYEWSTDWSNYFHAGKEWWGVYYWTVYNIEKSYVIAIGASSTD